MDMKKNLNLTYFILCCLIALALLQVGCGKSGRTDSPAASGSGKNPSASQTEPVELVMGYHPSPLALPEGLGMAQHIALGGNRLFVAGRTAGDAPALYAMDLDGESWQPIDYDAAEGDASRVIGLAATESRLFVVATGAWDTEAMFTTLATSYDAKTLQPIGRFELKEFAQGEPADMAAVGEALLCAKPYETIYVYSDNGQLLSQARPNGVLQTVSAIDGGAVACIYHQDGTYGLWELDTGTGNLSNLWTSPDGGGIPPTVSCASEDGWLLADITTVYDFDPDTGVTEPLFDWLDFGISGFMVRAVAKSAAGEIYTAYDGALYRLRAYEGPARTELTVGSTGGGGELETAIASFNMQSEKYVARLRLYSLEEADRLLTEVAAGKGPDILALSKDGPLAAITADGGVFTDLMPYIDADPDISRENFLPMALEGMAPDGHLYALASTMNAQSLVVDRAVLDSVPGWSVDDLITLSQSCDLSRTLFSGFQDQLLDILCDIASVEYVDFENASCSFDDPAFARWLELLGSIDYYQWPVTESSLLYIQSLSGWDAVSLDTAAGKQLAGFPGKAGPLHLFSPAGGYGVLAYSPNKEGAWELLRTMLLPPIQIQAYYCIPVMKDYVTAALTESAASYYKYVDTQLDKEAWMESIRPNIDRIAALTEEGVLARPSAIDSIITEEANRYFAGQKPLSETVAAIQSRASVFLAEQYS